MTRRRAPYSKVVRVLVAGAATALTVTNAVRADDPRRESAAERCAREAEEAQPLRRKSQYTRALEKLRACASPACPSVVAEDCARWEADVEAAMPTLVFVARDATGRDLPGVTVAIDGRPPERATGRAVAVDPGEHEVVFATEAGESATVRVIALDRQKGRLVVATFDAPPPPSVAPPPLAPPPHDAPPLRPPETSRWVWPSVLGGAALAAGATGGAFVLGADARYRELRAGCGATASCSSDDVDANRRAFIVGDVLLVASAALAAGAVWLFLSRPAAAAHATAR